MTGVDRASAAGVTVRATGDVAQAADAAYREVVTDRLPERLSRADPGLWGAEARDEAAVRLGWLHLPTTSRDLLPRLHELRERARRAGLDRVVLAGMGGSSLAPEVIARTSGVPLVVLDATDPGQVRRALADLGRTVVVVSSKSGTTVETDSHRRIFEQAFRDAGLKGGEVARRFVVVTDPGSPLADLAADAGYQTVLAERDVGGRYSALSAFGLVPSALAGADPGRLLDEAAALLPSLQNVEVRDNPALALGLLLGANGRSGRDAVPIADGGSGIAGFGDWAEQLLAESTGKESRGLLPVVVEGVDAPGFAPADDRHLVRLTPVTGAGGAAVPGTSVAGPLGAQFLAWEYATAVAGRLLEINPFDQPNVQESKDNTAAWLRSLERGPGASADGGVTGAPAFADGPVEVHADARLLCGARDLADVVRTVVEAAAPDGYLAIMAYLDRVGDADAAGLRDTLARRSTRPVTFGWGPRFLHSTGQYHKGGPQRGAFLQITGAVPDGTDIAVPGRPFSLGTLQLAQALGDLEALVGRARPVVRLHLRDRAAGVRALLAAARSVPVPG